MSAPEVGEFEELLYAYHAAGEKGELDRARAAVLAAYDAAKRARERVELARGVAMIDLTRTTRERDALAATVERVKALPRVHVERWDRVTMIYVNAVALDAALNPEEKP